MGTESVSHQIVDQRIRNRIFEYLEMLVAYESDPPPWDLNETINQWEDWVRSPVGEDQFQLPTYSQCESKQLVAVGKAMEAFIAATPQRILDTATEMKLPEWIALVQSANEALATLVQKGRMPEDHEI
jgi:hypothetical protein